MKSETQRSNWWVVRSEPGAPSGTVRMWACAALLGLTARAGLVAKATGQSLPHGRAERQGALTVVLRGPSVSAEGRRERDRGAGSSLHSQASTGSLCVRSAAEPPGQEPLPASLAFIVALVS